MSNESNSMYIAKLQSKNTGKFYYSMARSPMAAAINCFTKTLSDVPPESWQKHTELIQIDKAVPYQFQPDWNLLEMKEVPDLEGKLRWATLLPAGSEMKPLGSALVSLSHMGETRQTLDFTFKTKFFEKTTTHYEEAN